MAAYPSSIRQKIFIAILAYFLISSLIIIVLFIRTDGSASLIPSLIFCLVLLCISALILFFVITSTVMKPFKMLDENVRQISEGRSGIDYPDLTDKEIRSLNESLKKMAVFLSHDLELHRNQMMHTEKLASLGTFLSGIAHELVNPLSNIYSSSQILLEEIDEADKEYQKELITQIEQESGRARNIARSLLEFARESETKKEPLPLKNLIEETIRFIGAEKSPKVELILNIPEDIRIYADKQRIQQAFLNLIKNALEAISSEGTVSISAVKDHEEKSATVQIHDTGEGIDQEMLPRIFDAFFTTKGVGKGSGLGLFITQEIIKENKGSISAESGTGKGTTFTITLPCGEF